MIEICEVGPRDGLQNEKKTLSPAEKVEFIHRLLQAGLKKIEAVSFVNPKIIPQMADAEEVMNLVPKIAGVHYAGLVLSRSGLERALRTSIDTIHIVLAASDQFNLKNVRRTVEESKKELIKVIGDAKSSNKHVTGILGTAFGCPYEGNVPIERVLSISEAFLAAGCEDIVLADTTGLANPRQVQQVTNAFMTAFDHKVKLRLHFHNTRGLGLANTLAAYQAGVTSFDSSIGGLGGCPFAPKAVGNVCTEDMIHMFHAMNVETNVDLNKTIETARWIQTIMERQLPGMMSKIDNVTS